MINIKLPDEVLFILNKLNENNHEAYVVGGCVRDSIIGIEPNDWDITSNARPEDIMSLFEHTIPIGLKHGTVSVLINNRQYEITTYRCSGETSEQGLKSDLSKRDFTINAIAYNPELGLIDPFNGQKDIRQKIIQCVEDAGNRFSEDPLRMVRAVRFAAQFQFNIENKTYESIINNSELLKNVSAERVREELNKILLYDSNKLNILIKTGLMRYIIPEFLKCIDVDQCNPYHIYTISEHILKSTETIENDLVLKLTMLLHDIGKPQCKTIDEKGIGHFYGHPEASAEIAAIVLRRLKYDNETIKRVKTLILHHDSQIGENKKSVKKWLAKIGIDNMNDLLKVKLADGSAQNPVYFDDRFNKIQKVKEIIEEVVKEQECFSIKDLDVSGQDLIKAGFPQGREIGQVLNLLLEKVLEDSSLNQGDKLIEIAKKWGRF